MKSIEFVGPSSVGKSTFLKALEEQRGDTENWITKRAALKHISFNMGIKHFLSIYTSKVLYLLGLNINVPTNQKLFENYERDIDPLLDIFFNHVFDSGYSANKKRKFIRFYSERILYDLILLCEYFKKKRVIILDEGIIHNGGLHNSPSNLGVLANNRLRPSGVVFFELSDQNYFERIKKRFNEKGVNSINILTGSMTDEDVWSYIKHTKEKADEKLKVCKQIGIPLIEIEAKCKVSEFKKVNKFITEIYDPRN